MQKRILFIGILIILISGILISFFLTQKITQTSITPSIQPTITPFLKQSSKELREPKTLREKYIYEWRAF